MDIPFDSCLVIDFEASGLHAESWPTELAWANPHPDPSKAQVTSFLIRPHHTWDFWDPAAEKLTGITRSQLQNHGTPPSDVLAAFREAAQGKIILTDAPRWDAFWLRRLVDAAEAEAGPMGVHFQLADLELLCLQLAEKRIPADSLKDVLMAAERQEKLVEEAVIRAMLTHPAVHRAAEDVGHHLEVIRLLLQD